MKIKNMKLMLISAFLMVGSSAFATTQYAVYNGVRYSYADDETGATGAADKPFTATVYGVTADLTDGALAIPATFSKTDENDVTLYFKVGSFAAGWVKAAALGSLKHKDVTAALTALTIDAKNMGTLSNAFIGLTKLAKLTVSSDNASWTNEGYVTGHMALGTALETIEELDLSGLTKVEALAGDFKVSGNNWKKMTKLVLPANLTAIPANCFEGSNVTTLTIPAKVATIGSVAFKNSALTAIDLSGTKVTAIEAWTFEGCKDLATVTLPADLASIGLGAFYGSGITAIAIPEKVTAISNQTFQNCEALVTVTGMTKVTSIGESAFEGAGLTAFVVPASVTTIGASAFEGCESLATVTLNTTDLASIGNAAFKGTAITAFTLPATKAATFTYGDNVFEGCEALTTFTAAKDSKLATLGTKGFTGCKSLASLDIENSAVTTIWADGVAGCGALSEIKVPATLTEIKAGAFAGTVIEELDLSGVANTFTTLNDIFQGSEEKPYASLTSIKLPATLTTITGNTKATGVFRYCTGLEEIEIPSSLTAPIGAYTFYYCTALKSLTYLPTHPTTVKVIDPNAFIGCTPFVKINTNANYFAISTVEPTNATFGLADDLKVTTVADKGTSGKFFAKLCAPIHIQISKEDLAAANAKIYSVYEDEGIAYFQALTVKGGYYKIQEGEHVIVKSDAAATINFEIQEWPWASSLNDDDVFSFVETVNTADFQSNSVPAAKFVGGTAKPFTAGTHYIYALTNSAKNGGFGFTYYKGATLPEGAFFMLSTLKPSTAARVETVWLDEDGNVEGDATAIQNVKTATEDGAIYNAAGQKVSASYKGLVIKDGKKYIQK